MLPWDCMGCNGLKDLLIRTRYRGVLCSWCQGRLDADWATVKEAFFLPFENLVSGLRGAFEGSGTGGED